MFGSGKIQMLQSQLRSAEDQLSAVKREKSNLEAQLSAAASRLTELESQLAASVEKVSMMEPQLDAATKRIAELETQLQDFDLEQLKENAKTTQAEYEELKELYARKTRAFDDSKEEMEQAFAKKVANDRHSLENEIKGKREANQNYMADTVKSFSESYNYYLNQIRMLMDALSEVAANTGKTLFTVPREDLKGAIGQEIANKLKVDTDILRSSEDGLVLIAGAEEENACEALPDEEAIPGVDVLHAEDSDAKTLDAEDPDAEILDADDPDADTLDAEYFDEEAPIEEDIAPGAPSAQA